MRGTTAIKWTATVLLWAGVFLRAQGAGLTLYVDYAKFYDAKQGAFLELYYAIDGKDLRYQAQAPNRLVAKARLTATLKRGETVVLQENVELVSPELPDTLPATLTFALLHQSRTAIEGGTYTLEVQAQDQNGGGNATIEKTFSLPTFAPSAFAFSDVVFLNSIESDAGKDDGRFSKRGFHILPLVTNGFFRERDSLHFYVEAYNLDALTQEAYFVSTYITEANSEKSPPAYRKALRPRRPSPFEIFSVGFNIGKLPSQTYVLHIELKTNDGKLLAAARKKFFVYNETAQESIADVKNDYERYLGYPEEELTEYIAALQFMSTPGELMFAKTLGNFKEKQNYFVHFWQKRRSNPEDPYKEWRGFLSAIQLANKKFKAPKRPGWKTERGRVLLTYGPPSDLQDFANEADKFPYQIWTYNKLGGQANVIFVFYNRDVSSNDYPLLHSTLKGEPYNGAWRAQLMRSRNAQTSGANSDKFNDPNFQDVTPRTTGTPTR